MEPQTLLNLVIFLPLLGALLVAVLPAELSARVKYIALGFAVLDLLLSLLLLHSFNVAQNYLYQFETDLVWIAQFGVHFHVGLDGISLALVLLTTLLIAAGV